MLTVVGNYANGQNIFVNYDIDTNVYKVGQPLQLWLNFLSAGEDSLGSQYWNSKEVAKYGYHSYFLIEKELNFGLQNYLGLMKHVRMKVLSLRDAGDFYKITSMMEFPPQDSISQVQYVFHVYAGKEDGRWKLYNPLEINTRRQLNSSSLGYIRFHYPKYHEFDRQLAQKQVDALEDVARHFQVPMDTIDYYFAPTLEEIQRIKGFDFVIGDNGLQIPTGKADPANRIVYASRTGEYYPHEFIHILLNPSYPDSHNWIKEGVATYFGMSRGKPLEWHLQRLNRFLQQHPEVDLNNMLELLTMDQHTDYRYVLGGWVVKKAFEKGGYDVVKKLMQSGKSDADFYAALEDYLELEKQDLNGAIRQDLKASYSQ